jgi:hypothetical protein
MQAIRLPCLPARRYTPPTMSKRSCTLYPHRIVHIPRRKCRNLAPTRRVSNHETSTDCFEACSNHNGPIRFVYSSQNSASPFPARWRSKIYAAFPSVPEESISQGCIFARSYERAPADLNTLVFRHRVRVCRQNARKSTFLIMPRQSSGSPARASLAPKHD